jgi:exocyst complex component 5
VIGLFVNQHTFFIDRSQLISEEIQGDTEVWDRLADPDADLSGVEPSLQSLVDDTKVVVQEESFIIKRAFPYYELVLGKFIQRIFQQSVGCFHFLTCARAYSDPRFNNGLRWFWKRQIQSPRWHF